METCRTNEIAYRLWWGPTNRQLEIFKNNAPPGLHLHFYDCLVGTNWCSFKDHTPAITSILPMNVTNWYKKYLREGQLEWWLQREWKKHGSCMGFNPVDYYTKGYNIYMNLQPERIFEGLNLYESHDQFIIQQKIAELYPNATVETLCRLNRLEEITFYLNHHEEPIKISRSGERNCLDQRGNISLMPSKDTPSTLIVIGVFAGVIFTLILCSFVFIWLKKRFKK